MTFTLESSLLILTLTVLIGPLLAARLHMPGLVGLILMGTLFGPYVLDWIRPQGLVATVGAMGLLYLMFMAGLELDLKTFIDNRRAAITFGLLTFLIPFGLSAVVSRTVLDFSLVAAALIGAMWASHTLVAYPEVKAARLDENRAVGASVAATAITDVLALAVLAVASSTASVAADPEVGHGGGEEPLLPLWLGLPVLVAFTLWLLPRVVRWVFVHVCHTRTERFVVALAAMAAGAMVGLLGGIEGLVGAFLAGIGINRLIPSRSGLMEHIEFLGSALLIPAFLVAVGLSIDPRAVVSVDTLRLAAVFVSMVLGGKVVAAAVAGRLFGFSFAETGVLASLTIGQAAATLAIARVGVSTGIFSQQVMDAAVVTVVVTVFVTSLGTRFFLRRLPPTPVEQGRVGGRVVVDVASADQAPQVVAVAVALAAADGGEVVPVLVADDHGGGDGHQRLEQAVATAVSLGLDSEGVLRIDANPVTGIVGAVLEQAGTLLVLGWEGPRFPGDFLFGNSIDEVGVATPVPAIAACVASVEWDRVVVITGRDQDSAALRADIELALTVGKRLAAFQRLPLVLLAPTGQDVGDLDDTVIHRYREGDGSVLSQLRPGDLIVVPVEVARAGRRYGLRRLAQDLGGTSLLVVAGPHGLNVTPRPLMSTAHGVVAGRRSGRPDPSHR